MAHLPGRMIGLGIAMLSLLGATSAYAIAHTGPSTPAISPAPLAADGTSAHTAARVANLNAAPPPPPPKCMFNGSPIACSTPDGWWNGVDNCYWNLISPRPAPPTYDGFAIAGFPKTGNLYLTTCPANPGVSVGFAHTGIEFDTQDPPGYGGKPAVLPQLQGLQAVLSTGLLGPSVGIAPQPPTAANPNSTGLVGEPVWMWQNPSILTWGPLTAGLKNIL
ncbi:MAG TPA: hypothetical protein VGJ28_26140, partial [Micromonosporaceae bacterium]